MGSCSSLQKGASDAAVKLELSFSPDVDKFQVAEKAERNKSVADDSLGKSYEDLGSKEDLFFDSRPCLDTDCDEDFVSVNGDFASSCGSTPIRQISLSKNTPFLVQNGSPRKRLSELFRESSKDGEITPISEDGSPTSVPTFCCSERIANRRSVIVRGRTIKSVQCCIISFARCRSLGAKRKKITQI